MFRIVALAITAELALFIAGCIQTAPSLESFLQLFIALAVPACGWYGAKHIQKDALMYFCGCNFFFGFVTSSMCLLNWSSLVTLKRYCEDCSDPVSHPETCAGFDYATYEAYCEGKYLSKYENLCVVNTIIAVPLTVVYCFGYVYGKELYKNAENIFIVQHGGGAALSTSNTTVSTTPQMQVHNDGTTVEMSTVQSNKV